MTPRPFRQIRQRERGYALLMVMLFMVLLMLAAMTLSENVKTEGVREKETEMIWRGKQYVRGIKLYYRKTGRFPTALDDLTKPKTGLRFMRQAYKDPMNTEDGSWRLIYVGPAGQLIGSLKPNPGSLQLPRAGGAPNPGGAQSVQTPQAGNPPNPQNLGDAQSSAGQAPSGQTSGTGNLGTGTGSQGGGGQGSGTPAGGGQAGGFGGQPTGTDPQVSSGASSDTSNPQPIVPSQPTTIIGGNIIGVGSKINKKSVRIYEKGKKYQEWEFVWDPSKDVVVSSQPGTQIGTPIGTPPGGGQPGSPLSSQPNPNLPPNPPPNPNPQQP